MKPYKYKRQLQEQQQKQKKLTNSKNLIKITKQIAINHYKYYKYSPTINMSFDYPSFENIFLNQLYFELGEIYVDEHLINTYYLLFKKFMLVLYKKFKKAHFINKNYIPLESDLFEI